MDVHIALDLGSDTIKIAYAYSDKGGEHTGKLVDDPMSFSAIPSVAYYDVQTGKWLYGDEVETVGDKPFTTVVKIADLMRLLDVPENKLKNSIRLFKDGHRFPKFFFPRTAALTDDFEHAIARDLTFEDASKTPSDVCTEFFSYAAAVVVKRLDKLLGCGKYNIVPCLVYPAFSSKPYVKRLESMTESAFGKPVKLKLSMAKSLCAYSEYSGKMIKNEPSLIFNIGEERMSLVKVVKRDGGITIDGADGHSGPVDIGGKDIDDAVARYLEGYMSDRETMGRPSAGKAGHIAENALNSKQYLFMKNIKSAKVVFGTSAYERWSGFADGVPIPSSRDLVFKPTLTRERFDECIGIEEKDGAYVDMGENTVAERFIAYMREELERPGNSDVKKVYITGGPVETYGLVDYIRDELTNDFDIRVDTFEKPDSAYYGLENDGYNIMSHEDAVYAQVLGCAIASLRGMQIKLVLAQSYGIRMFRGDKPYFRIIVNKGEAIGPSGASFDTESKNIPLIACTSARSSSNALPVMGINLTEKDIAARCFGSSGKLSYFGAGGMSFLECNDKDRPALARLEKYAGLRVITGDIDRLDEADRAIFLYHDTPVTIIPETVGGKTQSVFLLLRLDIDCDGYAYASAENARERNGNRPVRIEYAADVKQNGNMIKRKGEREYVRAADIVFKYVAKGQVS